MKIRTIAQAEAVWLVVWLGSWYCNQRIASNTWISLRILSSDKIIASY